MTEGMDDPPTGMETMKESTNGEPGMEARFLIDLFM